MLCVDALSNDLLSNRPLCLILNPLLLFHSSQMEFPTRNSTSIVDKGADLYRQALLVALLLSFPELDRLRSVVVLQCKPGVL